MTNYKFDTNDFGWIVDDLLNPHIPTKIDSKFWQTLKIAVFDVETTGLNFENPDEFRITQFAAALYTKDDYEQGKKLKEINIRINPEIPTPEEVIEITGIYNSELDDPPIIEEHGKYDTKDCPTWKEVEPKINKFMYKLADIWCAYNHKFDVNAYASERFRNQKRKGKSFAFTTIPTIDPLIFHRRRKNKLKGNSLWNIARDYGVAKTGKVMQGEADLHEAQVDIELLNAVLWKMSHGMPATTNNLVEKQSHLLERQERYFQKKYGD